MGVMIDDLVTQGTLEPYRMFTSRAEYRLQLREDNADLRLTEKGRELDLVGDRQWQMFRSKRDAIENERERLADIWFAPGNSLAVKLEQKYGVTLSKENRALELLKRPEMTYRKLVALDGVGPGVSDPQVAEQVEIEVRYSGYLERQKQDIERRRNNESTPIPGGFDYSRIRGLSSEVREKLERAMPQTIGQASRIPGMTPAAISLLLVYLKKDRQEVA
jgi:tRNA uridine 5-carboxymethylaminomethyl modification enzyme